MDMLKLEWNWLAKLVEQQQQLIMFVLFLILEQIFLEVSIFQIQTS